METLVRQSAEANAVFAKALAGARERENEKDKEDPRVTRLKSILSNPELDVDKRKKFNKMLLDIEEAELEKLLEAEALKTQTANTPLAAGAAAASPPQLKTPTALDLHQEDGGLYEDEEGRPHALL